MDTALIYSESLASYRFNQRHPLVPERFTLAVELARAWGLVDEDAEVSAGGFPVRELRASAGESSRACVVDVPRPADDATLELAHTRSYIDCVRHASQGEVTCGPEHGIGPGDTPAFPGMHEAAALAVAATVRAVELVADGSFTRSFSPAGGLHHAHAGHASGFCVYNDVACAIESAVRAHPGLRVAYVDIDAHHGDGVEAAFARRSDVLTVSVHESGRYLFPGTGRENDIGTGAGRGFSLNLPLPPFSGPECYALAFERVLAPAVTAFAPDLLVLQAGADSHANDPLTHLSQTVAGYLDLVGGLLHLSEAVTAGRVVMTGGGGYRPYSEVPRMWAGALSLCLGRPVPESLPPLWLRQATRAASDAGSDPPSVTQTRAEEGASRTDEQIETAVQVTEWVISRVAQESPLL